MSRAQPCFKDKFTKDVKLLHEVCQMVCQQLRSGQGFLMIPIQLLGSNRGAPTGGGGKGSPPWDLKKTYIFRVSSVKLRELHF